MPWYVVQVPDEVPGSRLGSSTPWTLGTQSSMSMDVPKGRSSVIARGTGAGDSHQYHSSGPAPAPDLTDIFDTQVEDVGDDFDDAAFNLSLDDDVQLGLEAPRKAPADTWQVRPGVAHLLGHLHSPRVTVAPWST